MNGKERHYVDTIPWKKNGNNLTAEPFEREFSRIRNEFDSLLSRLWSGHSALGDEFFDTSRWAWMWKTQTIISSSLYQHLVLS